ncbi:MAG: hypothetical protein ACYTFY_19345, partial [Planctomycetota bacterium]
MIEEKYNIKDNSIINAAQFEVQADFGNTSDKLADLIVRQGYLAASARDYADLLNKRKVCLLTAVLIASTILIT